MTTSTEPEELDEDGYPPCEVCGTEPAPNDALTAFVDPSRLAALEGPIRRALAACARCLSLTGETIDRVHAEALLRAFGGFCAPLPTFLEAPARAARPDLAASSLLVYEIGAQLWQPADALRQRLASLESLKAPEVVIASMREQLAAREHEVVRLEWERVHPWPARSACDGSRAHAALAKVLARHAMPCLLERDAAREIAAIERAADTGRLDDEGWAIRRALADTERGKLAVRFLDELGSTDLRDNQDELLDDVYYTLRHHRLPEAKTVCRVWLEAAVAHALLSADQRGRMPA
jgi:hypothetical protein